MGLNLERVKNLIKKHEGLRLDLYDDTVGKKTIGYGRNIEDMGISIDEAELMLLNDIKNKSADLYTVIPNVATFAKARQAALIDMMFNLGMTRFRGFQRMLAAIAVQDWDTAADEMLDSKWAEQVGNRARELADMMRRGGDF